MPKKRRTPGELIEMPDPRKAEITQDDLEDYFGARHLQRIARKDLDRQAAKILERLRAGAKVEPGAHDCELIVKEKGGKHIEQLIIR